MATPIYDTDMGDHEVGRAPSTRQFQTSVIVRQDPSKSGVLSFLQQVEDETPPPPAAPAPQTTRPTGDYS